MATPPPTSHSLTQILTDILNYQAKRNNTPISAQTHLNTVIVELMLLTGTQPGDLQGESREITADAWEEMRLLGRLESVD